MKKLFLSLNDAARVAVREFNLDDFIEFGKKAFGVELTFKKSDNPDTYEKLFGTTKNDLGVDCVNREKEQEHRENTVVIHENLCDSCATKGCIFQLGIVRNYCDFYKSESEG